MWLVIVECNGTPHPSPPLCLSPTAFGASAFSLQGIIASSTPPLLFNKHFFLGGGIPGPWELVELPAFNFGEAEVEGDLSVPSRKLTKMQ